MLDPFAFWTVMWRAGASLADTGAKMATTVAAAVSIVDHRSRLIAGAVQSPMTGDYAELGRMAPEKFQALSQSALASFAEIQSIQAQLAANWHIVTDAAMAGRVCTVDEISLVTARSGHIVEQMSRAAANALEPIHLTVAANARRLGTT